MPHLRTAEMLLGGLVADAACLGLHWIYDPERITQITARHDGECAFLPVEAANYEGGVGYFAHSGRCQGMLTQYGENLRLAIRSMNTTHGDFNVAAYQNAFVAHFGPGGTYQGYIDRPTRAALANIASDISPSGTDDDQNPAIARIPAIVARYHNDETLPGMLGQSMQVTNVNDIAAAYSSALADVLTRVMRNEPLNAALKAAATSADASVRAELRAALAATDRDSTEFAGEVGRACHLPESGPVIFHILNQSSSYREAVEHNILAGGDNAGRSILIGAIMARVHGVATPAGVPLNWILQLKEGQKIWQECERLAQAVAKPG